MCWLYTFYYLSLKRVDLYQHALIRPGHEDREPAIVCCLLRPELVAKRTMVLLFQRSPSIHARAVVVIVLEAFQACLGPA